MSCEVYGKVFANKKTVCYSYGVPYQSLNYRMNTKNESIEEALGNLINKKREYSIFGKVYTNLSDIADDFKIDRIRFYGYMRKYNKDKDDKIIEDYINKQSRKERSVIKAFGKEYERLCDLERNFKLARYQLKGLEKKGQSILEDKLRHIMYKRYIINKYEDINIVKLEKLDKVIFVLDTELDKVLLYENYDESFIRERLWEDAI